MRSFNSDHFLEINNCNNASIKNMNFNQIYLSAALIYFA